MYKRQVFREYTDCLYASYGTKWNGNAAATNGSLFVDVYKRQELYEVEAPNGYTISTDPIPFTITAENHAAILEVESHNEPVKGTITVLKQGESLTGFAETEDEEYGTVYNLSLIHIYLILVSTLDRLVSGT